MANDLDSAVRQLLKELVREVALELSKVRPQSESPKPQMTPPPEEAYLITTREAAKRMSISERTLFSLSRAGKLPCVRIGTSVRYNIQTIQDWIRECEKREPPTDMENKAPDKARRTSTQLQSVVVLTSRQSKPKAESPRQRPQRRESAGSRKREKSTKGQSEEWKSPFSYLLDEVGVDRDNLPPLSNGALMRIAGVDLITFHGWMYLHKQMPVEALNRLKEHFRAYRKGDGPSADPNSNS